MTFDRTAAVVVIAHREWCKSDDTRAGTIGWAEHIAETVNAHIRRDALTEALAALQAQQRMAETRLGLRCAADVVRALRDQTHDYRQGTRP